MRRLPWIIVLLVLALTLACGEEEQEPAEEAAPEKTPQEIAEEKAPIAVETANELLGAVQKADKAKVLDMCFRDISTVSEQLGLTDEEIAESRVQQEAQLALFESFWKEMVLSKAYVIQGWTEPVVADIAPAADHPELVVYLTVTDVSYVLNGEEMTEAGKTVVIFNLGDYWFAQWPY